MSNELEKFVKNYQPKDFIIKESANEDDFFCLIEGSVSIWKGDINDPSNMVKVGSFDTKGAYFGEMGWLLKEKRTASIIADTLTQVLKFPGNMLPLMIQKHPKLGLKICTALADRLKGTTEKNEEVATQRNELRSDGVQDLLHAKEIFQKVFMLLTAIQSQFQNPLLKSAIDFMGQDRLLKGGKKLRLDEDFLQEVPDKLADLLKKHFSSN